MTFCCSSMSTVVDLHGSSLEFFIISCFPRNSCKSVIWVSNCSEHVCVKSTITITSRRYQVIRKTMQFVRYFASRYQKAQDLRIFINKALVCFLSSRCSSSNFLNLLKSWQLLTVAAQSLLSVVETSIIHLTLSKRRCLVFLDQRNGAMLIASFKFVFHN